MSACVMQIASVRLEMLLCREGRMKSTVQKVVAHKKRICSGKIASHKRISFFRTQLLECLQACAETDAAVPHPRGVVFLNPDGWRWKGGVVFHDYHARTVAFKSLPDVIVIPINVYRKHVKFIGNGMLLKERNDVFCCNERFLHSKLLCSYCTGKLAVNKFHRRVISLQPKTAPVLDKQIRSIILQSIADTKLNKKLIRCAKCAERFLQ